MPKETKNKENNQVKELFNTVKNLELKPKEEGLILVGYTEDDDKQSCLSVSIQGNRGNLIQALALAMDTDDDLRAVFQKAMLHSVVKKLAED